MTSAVVLLSGGQDSTTSLYWAMHRLVPGENVELHALSLYYGQRHASELAAARAIAVAANCTSHVEVDLAGIMRGGESDLLLENSSRSIKSDGGMRDAAMPQGLPTSFVPGRNLMFLALAAARAGAVGAQHVVTGVCQTDYSGYPDCRESFVVAMQHAVAAAWPSGEHAPEVHAPLMHLSKAQTVELARQLPGCLSALANSVTCYYGKQPGCGECPACALRRRGFDEAGEQDPAEEEDLSFPGAYP